MLSLEKEGYSKKDGGERRREEERGQAEEGVQRLQVKRQA